MLKRDLAFSALAVLAMALAWIIAALAVGNGYILPTVGDTVKAAWRLLGEAAFWRAFGKTLLRTLYAFLAALVLGTGCAALSSVCGFFRAFFAPVISFLRTVPTMAIILLLLIWTNPDVAPVIVSLLVLFPALYAAILSAADEVRTEYGELAEGFRVSAGRRLIGMYLPLAAPAVLGQAGSVFSMGLKITVSGEVLASTFRSLGGMMHEAQIYVDMPRLMALTVIVIFTGFLLEGAVWAIKTLLVRWRA